MKYEVVRALRKTVSLEVTRDGLIVVRAPFSMPLSEIDRFVQRHEDWIIRKQALQRARMYRDREADLRSEELIAQAKTLIPKLVKYYGRLMGLEPAALKITSAKTRFGSCSTKGSVCFSWRLMMYPQNAIEYVVVHELAHLKYRNHSNQFYALIEKYLPDYREREALLRGT